MRVRARHVGYGFAIAALGLCAAWLGRFFSARAVRVWRPGCGVRFGAGNLSVRTAGEGEQAFVLLHGLVASGDTFGAAYDRLARHGRLIVPDLLGFGRSMDAARDAFGLAEHLAALDAMAEKLEIASSPLIIGGHSAGGLLALHWAARRREQVRGIVTWGAPLFRDESEARERLKAMGWLERLFAQDSPLAERACAWMCAYRGFARGLAIGFSPDLPVTISGQAVMHTWPAYRGTIEVLFSRWQDALHRLQETRTPVTLVAGSRDRSQVAGLAQQLASRSACVRAILVPNEAHMLPITQGALCAEQLLGLAPGSARAGWLAR